MEEGEEEEGEEEQRQVQAQDPAPELTLGVGPMVRDSSC